MYDIEIISAPSILGLKPTGVEDLAASLLAAGLEENLKATRPVIEVPTLNQLYSNKRDAGTKCLNPIALRDFSLTLCDTITDTLDKNRFAFVLGGDCSILLGIMPALRSKGKYGLIFIDAHADFYEPGKSVTGEVADMELAIITGRGPELLTNINGLKPYVEDKHVVHVGQRDGEETKKYQSQDILETGIKCFPLSDIESRGMERITNHVLLYTAHLDVEGFWIHFDADVLSDELNPAVDYRLPGGLSFAQIEQLLCNLLLTGSIVGISVTIFNPRLDNTGNISKSIAQSLGQVFEPLKC
jgi:arginase